MRSDLSGMSLGWATASKRLVSGRVSFKLRKVRNPGQIAGGLLCILLAGCSSIPVEQVRAPDWSADSEESRLSAPQMAAPGLEPAIQALPRETEVPAPSAVAPLVAPAAAWVPLDQWCQNQGLPQPERSSTDKGLVYSIGRPGQPVSLYAFSHTARWRGIDIQLGYPTQISNGGVVAHSMELRKTILPLLTTPSTRAGSLEKVIVLDPGHGGIDGGACSASGLLEKDLTLDWARRAARLLAAQGWQVILTRTNDADLSLSNRIAVADQCHASVFVSLHLNSAGANHTQSGLETYCLTPAGLPSGMTRGFADDTAAEFPNNAWDDENLLLACKVHGEISRLPRVRDRGVRRARFLGVLRGQQRPAILVEGGYLSNAAEARDLGSPAHRQKLAQAVAQGVSNWMSGPADTLAAAAFSAAGSSGTREAAPKLKTQSN